MKRYIAALAACGIASAAWAQTLKPDYVIWPTSTGFPDYVVGWTPGQPFTPIVKTSDGQETAWEDEEFFTSRVKPKARFRNQNTQVDPSITEGADKKLAWWVPCGDLSLDGAQAIALPNGRFDSEAFSMWQYITHWGLWSSPQGWVPGAFADAAHKNGVAVSGVASIPYGSPGTAWNASLEKYGTIDQQKAAMFLLYHGVDGLGYNSEFNASGAMMKGIRSMNEAVLAYMQGKNPLAENLWYDGTNDNGSISFDGGLANHNKLNFGDGATPRSSLFFNYNSNGSGLLSASVRNAQAMGRNPLDLYVGHDMQGSQPRSGETWPVYKDYPVSIGLWGAHSTNMFWQDRNTNGSSPVAMQRTYMRLIEQWFGNGPRNPAVRKPVATKRQHRPDDDFHGMSSMMTAKSTLSWDIQEEPFYTYFNLGNGQFFNWHGARVSDNEWYNIGIQDYLPTWRFWFAPSFLQGEVAEGETSLAAEFTWDDAYMGGSCLKVSGTADKEYLHLFKTNFATAIGDTITLRYKVLEGQADLRLVFSKTGAEAVEIAPAEMVVLNAADCAAAVDESTAGWQTFKVAINAKLARQLGTVALVGLRLENARNIDLLLGELSIMPKALRPAPGVPAVRSSRVLSNNHKGVDGKIIYSMANDKPAGEPCYNSDVNASMFRIWAQEQGGEPKFIGATTSWAAIAFRAPNALPDAKIRFGVSAVGIDMRSESAIAWGEWLDKGAYDMNEDFAIDKSIIKPGERFTISYIDPRHEPSTWEISAIGGKTVYTATGTSAVVEGGLSDIGPYNLTVTSRDGVAREYPRYIYISSEASGGIPEILSLGIGAEEVGEDSAPVAIVAGEELTFSYRGRKADGVASRGIDLNENWLGTPVRELGIEANQSFSVAAWVKYNSLPKGRSNFITIENRAGDWPYNNWGFFWSRITDEGKFVHPNIDTAWGMRTHNDGTEGMRLFYRYDDAKLQPGAWTHVAIVFEYEPGTSNVRQHFYINGQKQKVSAWASVYKSVMEGIVGSSTGDWTNLEAVFRSAVKYGSDTYEPGFAPTNKALANTDWISFGGSSHEITAAQGSVDDFQVWGKAMTQDDVNRSLAGLDGDNLPEGVIAYWDFEGEPNPDYSFSAKGSKAGAKAYWYKMALTGKEGQATQTPQQAAYLDGCPYIEGSAYPIVTRPQWSAAKAVINGDGDDQQGHASIAFSGDNSRVVTLKLVNAYGVDARDYPVIKVGQGIEAVEAGEIEISVVDKVVLIEFADAGDYQIDVYDMQGRCAASRQGAFAAGDRAAVNLGAPGAYAVRVASATACSTAKVVAR